MAYTIAENTRLCDYMGAWTLLQEEKVGAYCTEHKDIYVALLILTSNSNVMKNYCICMGLQVVLNCFNENLTIYSTSRDKEKTTDFGIFIIKKFKKNEPLHGNTNNLHMRKQRRRSASQ